MAAHSELASIASRASIEQPRRGVFEGYVWLAARAPQFDYDQPQNIPPRFHSLPNDRAYLRRHENAPIILRDLIREKLIGGVVWSGCEPRFYGLVLKDRRRVFFQRDLYQSTYLDALRLESPGPGREHEAIQSLGAPFPPGELVEEGTDDPTDGEK